MRNWSIVRPRSSGRINGLSTDCFASSSESKEETFEESWCREVSEDKLSRSSRSIYGSEKGARWPAFHRLNCGEFLVLE